MSNWNISKKIAVGFIAVLIQAISVGVYALWSSTQAASRLNTVASQYLPETELAASVERELLNARIHFIYFVTIQKPGSLEKGRERLSNAIRELPRLVELVQNTEEFADIRPDATRLQAAFKAYEPALEGIIQVVQSKQNSGPEFAAQLSEWASLGGAMVDSAMTLHKHGVEASNNWAKQASARHETAILATGCIGGSVLGILLTLLVTRSISSVLRSLTEQLRVATRQVADAASGIASSAQSLSDGASSQAASLQETSASSEEINSMAAQNAMNSKSAAENMVEAAARVEQANHNLQQMVGSMNEINASSAKISKIIKVIDEIAFQTNILALNAAVEAARAGEAGMGFAVVADEVRNLAQRSAQAARDTTDLIEESIARSTDGKDKLNQVAAAVQSMTLSANTVRGLVEDVKAGSEQQARGIEQVSKAILQMEKVTQTTAAHAQQSASSGQELTAQSAALEQIVHRLHCMVGGA
jgi:methyl-accepting chemotaxis protein